MSITEDGVLDLNGILKITHGQFNGNQSIKKIIIGNTLKKIGVYTFQDCKELVEVDFTNTKISIIPESCFLNCIKLESIILPNEIKIIDSHGFSGCKSLKNIILYGIVTIEEYAFSHCNNIKYFEISSEQPQTIHKLSFENVNKLISFEILVPQKLEWYFILRFDKIKIIKNNNEYVLK